MNTLCRTVSGGLGWPAADSYQSKIPWRRTVLELMIWLTMPNLILWAPAPGFRPPAWGGTVPFDIRVRGLLLRGDLLDNVLGNGPTGHLLDALEALRIEIPNRLRVTNLKYPFRRRKNGRRVVVYVASRAPRSLPSSGLRHPLVVQAKRGLGSTQVVIIGTICLWRFLP